MEVIAMFWMIAGYFAFVFLVWLFTFCLQIVNSLLTHSRKQSDNIKSSKETNHRK